MILDSPNAYRYTENNCMNTFHQITGRRAQAVRFGRLALYWTNALSSSIAVENSESSSLITASYMRYLRNSILELIWQGSI